jgi:hypothetical protein
MDGILTPESLDGAIDVSFLVGFCGENSFGGLLFGSFGDCGWLSLISLEQFVMAPM